MNHIHLTDHEAKNIDRISVLVRPVKCSMTDACGNNVAEYEGEAMKAFIRHNCPYTVGQTVGLKESWACDETIGLLYKAHYFDSKDEQEVAEHYGACPVWESPVTMPLDFIRHHRIIAGIKVKRLRSIGFEEIDRLGISTEYPDWESVANRQSALLDLWQSHYAKTKFAWEKNPWCWMFELKQQ